MKYFLDCEFIEDDGYISLISIGIVSEDNREYYAINKLDNWELIDSNDWVKENVLNSLYDIEYDYENNYSIYKNKTSLEKYYKLKNEIKTDILDFVGNDTNPQFFGEWCSYDWVSFCWIFGNMSDLPKHFPMRCRDIIQMCEDELNIPSDSLPESLETPNNHNALLGAKTVQMRYNWLVEAKNNLL